MAGLVISSVLVPGEPTDALRRAFFFGWGVES